VIKSLGSEKEDPHRCFIFGPLASGPFINLTEKTNIKYFPANINELRGRRKELFDLVLKICEGERLLQLLGLPGTGKSSLARSALHYLYERRFFLGGIIFV
jgi:MoxR-like ATPase